MATVPQAYELPFGLKKAVIQKASAVLANTFTDTGDLVTDNDHGLLDGERIVFRTIVTTTGASVDTYYFVISATTNTFQIATTAGGSAVALTTNGTGTYQAIREYELDWPQTLTANATTQTPTYTGGNKEFQRVLMTALSITMDLDCMPTEAHRNIFEITEVTANLPDGYTSATPMLHEDARSGVTVGLWVEADTLLFADDGDQSDGLVRDWFPAGVLSLVAPQGRATGDKPSALQYSFNVSMEPTSDVLGIALPSGLSGAPYIRMTKAV